jgi:WS/DGAT/MGAT family acyltransferase
MLKQLTGLDSMFLYLEKTRTPLEVSSLQIYDPSTVPGGKVRFSDILATFDSRLERSKVFRRKLLEVPFALDHPYWVEDKDFDIEYHVRHIALPRPGDWRQLMIQISRLQSQHLDKSRPLWETYIIEGLDNVEGLNKGCFGMFTKFHHATVDGASGQKIQEAIHDQKPVTVDQSDNDPGESRKRSGPPATWGLLAKSPINYLKNSTKLVVGVATAVPGLILAGLANRNISNDEVPKILFNAGRASANRVIDGRFYKLAEVKAISRVVENTSVNDCVLTVISVAMRNYLESMGCLPDQSLVTSCPINIRDDDGRHDGHDNMVSQMRVSLHSNIADPVKRMHAIHESAKKSKAMTRLIGAETLSGIPLNLPAPIARSLLPATVELMARAGIIPFNTLITNVVGIQQPLYLAGAKLVSMMGIIPVLDYMGLTHTAYSYNGTLSITFTACREMLPDPAFYASCLEESYEELKRAALPAAPDPAADKPNYKRAVKKQVMAKKARTRLVAKSPGPEKKELKKTLRKKALRKKAAKKTAAKKLAKKAPAPSGSMKKKSPKKKALKKKPD